MVTATGVEAAQGCMCRAAAAAVHRRRRTGWQPTEGQVEMETPCGATFPPVRDSAPHPIFGVVCCKAGQRFCPHHCQHAVCASVQQAEQALDAASLPDEMFAACIARQVAQRQSSLVLLVICAAFEPLHPAIHHLRLCCHLCCFWAIYRVLRWRPEGCMQPCACLQAEALSLSCHRGYTVLFVGSIADATI